MCGIAGAMEFGGRTLEPTSIERMVAVLSHRGPERQAVHLLADGSTRVGLGHARLKIIDLSDNAAQPMCSDDGATVIAFNGEIYNYRELRAQLQQRGVRFRTTSDTEVILRWYEAEGAGCVKRFEGMFAFAVWDRRKRELLLARDRVGKKPLFYAADAARIVFASEIKALLQYPGIEAAVHHQMLPAFFLYGYVPSPQTLYRHILQLPPGHLARVSASGSVRLEAYWELPLPGPASAQPPSLVEASTHVRELLTEAVRRRLIADVPLGAFLSGGLDSSIVVGLMRQLTQEPVRTFSIGFSDQPHFDETRYARLAAQRFGTRHTEFFMEPIAIDLVERLVWHHDGPFADSSAIPTYVLSGLTQQHVTVALTGDGGDELFAGYLRFAAAAMGERIPRWVRVAIGRACSGLPTWGDVRGPVRRAQKFARGIALPLIERFVRFNSIFYDDLPLLLPDQQELDGSPAALQLLEPSLHRSRDSSTLTRLLDVNLKTYLLDDLLVKTDRCSMAHALEARSPFLDRALMEYVFALPDEMKLRGGTTKYLLRRAFADLVPSEILQRGKMGFGVPLQAWFSADLRDHLHDTLLAPDAKLRHYVNPRYVSQLYEEHLAAHEDHSARLWTLLTFELWLRNLPTWSAPFENREARADHRSVEAAEVTKG